MPQPSSSALHQDYSKSLHIHSLASETANKSLSLDYGEQQHRKESHSFTESQIYNKTNLYAMFYADHYITKRIIIRIWKEKFVLKLFILNLP